MKQDFSQPRKKVFQKIRHNFQDAAHIVRTLMVVALGIGAIAVSAMYLSKEAVTADSSHVVNGRALPIYCVETDAPKIALTFDAAWGNEDTADILAILAKHDVKVTFFMTGGWIENYPEDVKAIYEAGHDLGNHSQTHPDMATISTEEIRRELMDPYESVKELTGYEMSLFRPPYGSYNNELIEIASDCGFYTIQWDVDSLDWKDYGVDSIINTVCNHKHLGNGSIILCHNGSKYTAQALDTLITNLKAQGYEFVKLSELIYTDNYYMDHEGRPHPQQ